MTITLDPEEREQFDAVVRDLVRSDPSQVAQRQPRDPDAPDWWLGDEEASITSMAAARQVRASG